MKYNFPEDIKSIREILGLSQSEFAEQIGVEQVTISRNELGKTEPSAKILESVYTFAFAKNIKINKLKEMLWRDDLRKNEKLLFHGAKSEIDGEIDIRRGRYNNDFGQGFYTGESYEQAISFVSGFDQLSCCNKSCDSGVRKLLADIQIEEQNHAEMLYKYKTVNGMA